MRNMLIVAKIHTHVNTITVRTTRSSSGQLAPAVAPAGHNTPVHIVVAKHATVLAMYKKKDTTYDDDIVRGMTFLSSFRRGMTFLSRCALVMLNSQ